MMNENNMNSVNKTLYIPLYGKAYVSERNLFLRDEKAEEIWRAEAFALKGKSKSKWLAYYMGIRSAVFDDWVKTQMIDTDEAVIIHVGCGLDSRILRIGEKATMWYDVDFPEVIAERKRYYAESDRYRMLAGDVREVDWLRDIPQNKKAIVVMEGVSMYLSPLELCFAIENICAHFEKVSLLMDCYTVLAAKMSKYKNPIHDVGVKAVYGIDNPLSLEIGGLTYVKEYDMTPQKYVDELCGVEKKIFGKLYAGRFSRKLYRLFGYEKR